MDNFVAYELNMSCEAVTAVSLPRFNGSTLRGAFFGTLRRDFCLNNTLDSCLLCPMAEVCPICRLVATVERDNDRGAEIPRPFTLQPITTESAHFEPGQSFTFGITLFGKSLSLFPYAILALQKMGETGMGNRSLAPGRFVLRQVTANNSLTGIAKIIYSDSSRIVNVPDIAITHADVLDYAARLDSKKVEMKLLTPLRLVVESSLVQKLTFKDFMQRLLRRLTDLNNYYGDGELNIDFNGLLQQAAEVQVVPDNTRWLDLSSYSSRRQTGTPIGGLIGDITFTGDLNPFLPLLVWGQITHVGKDATKGNGWYRIAGN